MVDELQPWPGILAAIGTLITLALGLVGLSGAVWLMIWPVERRARATKGRFRFRLIDGGCLLVYWQVILAALVALGRGSGQNAVGMLVCLGVLFCLISALTWSVCVGVLSRAGIESSACRAAFILVSIPGAIAASVGFVASGIAVLMDLYFLLFDPLAAAPLWMPLLGFLLSMGAIFLLRLLSQWIAGDARAADPYSK